MLRYYSLNLLLDVKGIWFSIFINNNENVSNERKNTENYRGILTKLVISQSLIALVNPSNSLLTIPRRWFWCGSLLPVFGVRVSVMFHHMFVHYTFSSVWVAEWSPFWKYLPTRLAICFRCILSVCDFGYFSFWFWGWDLPSDCSSSCSLLSHYFYHQSSCGCAVWQPPKVSPHIHLMLLFFQSSGVVSNHLPFSCPLTPFYSILYWRSCIDLHLHPIV